MTAIELKRKLDLEKLKLQHGAHNTPEQGFCVMEAVAYVAGEPHSDHPECVSPIIGAFLRTWNDCLDDAGRQRLKPYIPKVVGTRATADVEDRRGWLCADWLVRQYTPAWLELAGLKDQADALRAIGELHDIKSATAAQTVVKFAEKKASAAESAAKSAAESAAWSAAWSAAESAAWSAAWSAAKSAAESAAWSAAWSAAKSAAKSAAWSAAKSAAESAAWSAAWSAAKSAAESAAWSAAWSAAKSAAWSAAWSAAKSAAESAAESAAKSAAEKILNPTKQSLQESAFQLLDKMIALGAKESRT